MQTLSLSRICELDVACIPVRVCFESIRLGDVDHEDNKEVFMEIARGLGITLEEVASYVWLQIYIRELTESTDDLPSVEIIARQFGIEFAEFERYLGNRVETLQSEHSTM